ncbi:HNH endonuclease [Priestia flexa]|uniref:HNH endonuclease n=1 Tax=Priestia flexa TaxID=86664 RepID=UPI003D00C9F2
MRENKVALNYFVQLMKENKIEYRNGELWRKWELRRGWLENPKKVTKETSNGYIMLRTSDKRYPKHLYVCAHRVIWAFFNGEIPEGMVINHINGNKKDNRIENLEVVTPARNVRHAIEIGLTHFVKGNDHYSTKVKDEEVAVIKFLLKNTDLMHKEISSLFGVNQNLVSRIGNGKRRGEIKMCETLSLNDYQKLTERTDNKKDPVNMRLANYSLGLVCEGAEVGDHIKKHVFHGHELDKEKVLYELGDTFFYLARIAAIAGFTLEEVATANISKLSKRYKNGFSKEASIKRVDTK